MDEEAPAEITDHPFHYHDGENPDYCCICGRFGEDHDQGYFDGDDPISAFDCAEQQSMLELRVAAAVSLELPGLEE